MQTTSSGFASVVNAPFRQITTGVLLSWMKNLASNVSFFTINTSLIAGSDIIKGAGSDTVSFFDKYNYTDYATSVMNWSVDRQIGQFPFGLIMAQADVQLDNTSNEFTPNYDPTIGSGILPNRPLKINLSMGADSLQQFTGYTGQPTVDIQGRNLTMHAYDVLDYLNNYNFTSQSGTTFSGLLSNVTTSSAIQYYLGALGFNANQYRLDASLMQPIGVVNVTDRKFGDVLNDLVSAEMGILQADESGIIEFWNRQHFVTTSGLGFLFNLTPSNCINITYTSAPIINDVTVTAKPRAVVSFRQVWKQGEFQTIQPGQSLDVFADFSDGDGALPVTNVTTPVYNLTDINSSFWTTNSASDGSGSTNASDLNLTSTFLFGTTYRMTFSNPGTSTVFITALTIYGTPATVVNTIVQNYVDQDSINAYGRNPANNGESLPISNDYLQSTSDALTLGFTIVSQYGKPNRHYQAEIFSNPAYQIGDYGKLTLPDTGLVKTVWITGKTDKLNPEGNLTQMLSLEERTLFTYFTINASAIGSSDVIAP